MMPRPDDRRTVQEALTAFRSANGIDPPFEGAPTWKCRIGPLTFRLPNFRWRREAILRHDLHHILTGHPCTMRGEFQMAAWEFAAGRFPHPAATLFCLPLVAAGIMWSPRAIWRAFLAGRHGQSLYGIQPSEDFLQSSLDRLRAHVPSATDPKPRLSDIAAFCSLITQAGLLVIGSAAAVALIVVMFS